MTTIDVYIKLTSGRVFHMPLPSHETVRSVCDKVAVEEGVSGRCLRLKYTGKILKKDHTLAYLGVRPETILKVNIIQAKSLTIHVKCLSGVTIPLTIQNVTTLKEIIERITNKQGNASSSTLTTLKLKGKPLSGDSSLAQDLGIEDETMLEAVEQSAAANNTVEDVVEELDQATLDELLANFADGLDRDRKIEVVFSFDTTGSMYASLTEVRSKLDATVTRLMRDIPNIRIGIMSHGDYCDQSHSYVVSSIDLTSDAESLLHYINHVSQTGGEGSFACYEWVMRKAQALSWSDDAAKALVIIGDVTPHCVSHTDQRINWHDELGKLCQKEIKIYGIQVRNESNAVNFYKEISEKSQGAYIKFQYFNYLTDMFLAVCYREAGEEQLQQFAEEVKQEGRMTQELTDMFTQLEPTAPTANENENQDDAQAKEEARGERYVCDTWWDPKLDTGSPIYTYSAEDDSWSRFYRQIEYHSPVSSQVKKKLTKRCAIM